MFRTLTVVLAVAMGAAVAASTALRAQTWGDEAALWIDARAKAPARPRAHINLGQLYALRGERALAIAAFERALELVENPRLFPDDRRKGYGIAHANLAMFEWADGKAAQAQDRVSAAYTRTGLTALRELLEWYTARRRATAGS